MTSVTEIISRVWLGNKWASQDSDFLQKNNIKVIVNCTKDIPFCEEYGKNKNVSFYRIPIDDPGSEAPWDENHEILYEKLPLITQKLYQHALQHAPILVHCHAGIQRSASVVVALLMRYGVWKGKSSPESVYRSAVNCVIKKRNVAFFGGESVNFEKVLLKFCKDIPLNLV